MSIFAFPKKHTVLVLAALVFTGVFLLRSALSFSCFTPPERVPQQGSQGYQTWYGENLRSFYHRDKKVCVPDGWEAVGAVATGAGWAKFESGVTGIMLRIEAFSKRTFSVPESNFEITLRYPASASVVSVAGYTATVKNALSRAGTLFNDTLSDAPVPHTVLVTAGLEDSLPDETHIYPDPRRSVTIFVRDPQDPRAEELVIHAFVHLYNRFSTERLAYQTRQPPLAAADIQELEATWAETAFSESSSGRAGRLGYLFSVHEAVAARDFSRITKKGPPFDDRDAFEAIRPSVLVPPGAPYLDEQYGHYVLAPLALTAVDGLLFEKGAPADVEEILRRVHSGEAENLFTELSRYLTEDELATVMRWVQENGPIPGGLVRSALAHYAQQ